MIKAAPGTRWIVKACPRCGEESVGWHTRKVCSSCRGAELQTPEYKAKTKVWGAVNRALKTGQLVRQPCEVCGATKSEAHHDDYAKPLDVRWLCRVHHREHHNLRGFAEPSSQPHGARQ